MLSSYHFYPPKNTKKLRKNKEFSTVFPRQQAAPKNALKVQKRGAPYRTSKYRHTFCTTLFP